MKIDFEFELGQIVYLVTDESQVARMVVAYHVSKNGVLYSLACGNDNQMFYGVEISANRNNKLLMGIN